MIKHAVISIINENGSCLTFAFDGTKYQTSKELLKDMIFDIEQNVAKNTKWLEGKE